MKLLSIGLWMKNESTKDWLEMKQSQITNLWIFILTMKMNNFTHSIKNISATSISWTTITKSVNAWNGKK